MSDREDVRLLQLSLKRRAVSNSPRAQSVLAAGENVQNSPRLVKEQRDDVITHKQTAILKRVVCY